MVCLVPYYVWIMNRLKDWLHSATNSNVFCVYTKRKLLGFLSSTMMLSFKRDSLYFPELRVAFVQIHFFSFFFFCKNAPESHLGTFTSLKERCAWRAWQCSNHSNQHYFSGQRCSDKTRVGAEPTNLDARWALWPSPGTPPTACRPTQCDGCLRVSADIVAGIIAPPRPSTREIFSRTFFSAHHLWDATEQEHSHTSKAHIPKVPPGLVANVMRHC